MKTTMIIPYRKHVRTSLCIYNGLNFSENFWKKFLFIAIYRKSLTALVIGQSLDVCSDLRREER